MRNHALTTGIFASLLALTYLTPPSVSALTISKKVTISFATHSSVSVSTHAEYKTSGLNLRRVGGISKPAGKSPTSSSRTPNTHTPPQAKTERVVLPEFKKDVARHIKAAFPDDARIMIAIAMAESGLNCAAINHKDSNGVQAVGLFQINDGRIFSVADIHNLQDCTHNIERAKSKYAYGRFSPWGVWHSGSYQKFLWIYDEI